MRLRLATRFSALIVAIFVLALLSNLMALFVAWRVNSRLAEIAGADVPSADAASAFRTAIQEERLLFATYAAVGGEADWLKAAARVESHLRNALDAMRRAAGLFEAEEPANARLLAQLKRIYAAVKAQRTEAVGPPTPGDKDQARRRLLAAVNDPAFKDADAICGQIAEAADAQVREHAARVARRVRQATWVIGTSGGLTVCLGGGLLWLLFRRIVIPLQTLVTDARSFNGRPLTNLDGSEPDEMGTVDAVFRGLMSDVTDTRSTLERSRSRLLAAEKLASVGKLAASVAHEIRNPLTAMKMWLFSLRESVAGDAELGRKLGIVADETTKLDHIVRDFLEFARPPGSPAAGMPDRVGDRSDAGTAGRVAGREKRYRGKGTGARSAAGHGRSGPTAAGAD